MTPAPRGKKRRKFDPKAFLSTIDGSQVIATFRKRSGPSLLRGTPPMLFFTYRKERQD
jgi:hypothetical protein